MSEDDLDRFVRAQDADGTYETALRELRAGAKKSHWMWFVLPQVKGLGRSQTSRYFGLDGRGEAAAYVAHPVLGPRLVTAARALAERPERDASSVLGSVDAQKLQSCMTLFCQVAPEEPVFAEVLEQYFDGELDQATLDLL
jgi:uncharacterized protein (DUF1810 family)